MLIRPVVGPAFKEVARGRRVETPGLFALQLTPTIPAATDKRKAICNLNGVDALVLFRDFARSKKDALKGALTLGCHCGQHFLSQHPRVADCIPHST